MGKMVLRRTSMDLLVPVEVRLLGEGLPAFRALVRLEPLVQVLPVELHVIPTEERLATLWARVGTGLVVVTTDMNLSKILAKLLSTSI